MTSPSSRSASAIVSQRHGDRQARAPMYQCRPRGTSQTGRRPGSAGAGGSRRRARPAHRDRRRRSFAQPVAPQRAHDPRGRVGRRRLAVQARREPRPRPVGVDEPLRRRGRPLRLHARGIGPQPVREQRDRDALALPLRGALEQLADPRRRDPRPPGRAAAARPRTRCPRAPRPAPRRRSGRSRARRPAAAPPRAAAGPAPAAGPRARR